MNEFDPVALGAERDRLLAGARTVMMAAPGEDAMPEMGVTPVVHIDGAFYIYCDIGRYSNDSMSFCRDVLNGAGVAITPGLDFDEGRGARTVRLSFAGSLAECQEAVSRLGAWLQRRI